jgi:hypothetical protein
MFASELSAIETGMVGACIPYDALPYEVGTPNFDRLVRIRVDNQDDAGSKTRWILDKRAASDFVRMIRSKIED